MGLFDRFKKDEPAAPEPSKSKRKGGAGIACTCGKSFRSADEHHAHLHREHPEHAH